MKEEILNFKGTYEEAIKFIYKNLTVSEPTSFKYTRIINTNAKQRRYNKALKNVYSYEVEGTINLNDDKHKENLYNKFCLPKYGYSKEDFIRYGID